MRVLDFDQCSRSEQQIQSHLACVAEYDWPDGSTRASYRSRMDDVEPPFPRVFHPVCWAEVHGVGELVELVHDHDNKVGHAFTSMRMRHASLEAALVLDRFDPEGLLAMGALVDEYKRVAQDLVEFVLGPEAPTAASVQAVWRRWFGMDDGSSRMTSELARSISLELQSLRDTLRP